MSFEAVGEYTPIVEDVMRRRVLAGITAVTLTLGLSACGEPNNTTEADRHPNAVTAFTPEPHYDGCEPGPPAERTAANASATHAAACAAELDQFDIAIVNFTGIEADPKVWERAVEVPTEAILGASTADILHTNAYVLDATPDAAATYNATFNWGCLPAGPQTVETIAKIAHENMPDELADADMIVALTDRPSCKKSTGGSVAYIGAPVAAIYQPAEVQRELERASDGVSTALHDNSVAPSIAHEAVHDAGFGSGHAQEIAETTSSAPSSDVNNTENPTSQLDSVVAGLRTAIETDGHNLMGYGDKQVEVLEDYRLTPAQLFVLEEPKHVAGKETHIKVTDLKAEDMTFTSDTPDTHIGIIGGLAEHPADGPADIQLPTAEGTSINHVILTGELDNPDEPAINISLVDSYNSVIDGTSLVPSADGKPYTITIAGYELDITFAQNADGEASATVSGAAYRGL